MPTLTIGQKIKERPLWLPMLARLIVNGVAVYGLELDAEQLIAVFLLVEGIVTWYQQRKVTSIAKIERLDSQNAIGANPKVAATVVEVLTTPPKELPPTPAPFPSVRP